MDRRVDTASTDINDLFLLNHTDRVATVALGTLGGRELVTGNKVARTLKLGRVCKIR